MSKYTNSPLGLNLHSQSNDIPNNIGQYRVVGNTFSSLFTNDQSTKPFFQFNVDTSNYNSDIKTTSIIEYTNRPGLQAMKLKPSDFAYLKNLGVFPNNRLIIARRFDAGVDDDLTVVSAKNTNSVPVSTLISWVPDNTEFISTDFGEEWVDGEASFKDILNSIGKDVLSGDNKGGSLGNLAESALGIVPLSGFTEGLQWEIFKSLGMSDLGAAGIPIGNPNIIREAKRRKTLDPGSSGTGLKCKFKIEMTVEYEQKFVNGVDPTIVYYDIIANALNFGTSESKFQFRGDAVDGFSQFLDNIGSGDPVRLRAALLEFVSKVSDAISAVGKKITNELRGKDKSATGDSDFDKAKAKSDARKEKDGDFNRASEFFKKIGATLIQGMVSKYKIRIMSVVNSLTGTPSAPWHVTIGNPRRPIFSSGDMLVEEVSLSLGKLLSFNDLPSSIKLKFTLTSARNLGAQEIYKKFNCGKERTYVKTKFSFVEQDVVFRQDEIDAQSAKTANEKLIKNSKSSTNETEDVNKAGESSFPDGIKNIPGVRYITGDKDVNGDYIVTAEATTTQSITNTDGKHSIQQVRTQFYPNKTMAIFDDKNKFIGSGDYEIAADGSVIVKPRSNKFTTSKIG